ncbi:hypothetical protein HB364_13820 [Pseudoflavitalea sp. X16]|uniref:hypothetical protein n=1 Tax=Paraflavitalea devenefica TaxID=2716334 RepID=UPI00141F67E2|nr:hypothetical protein [Paraflavitalea devenefica]NII26166.1 hypothetical protein [Paraflavitalea devenefica]
MSDNRVKNDIDAFWANLQQEYAQNPNRANSPGYLKGQLQLLDEMLKKYKNPATLSPSERASLVTLKSDRDEFYKRVHLNSPGNLLKNIGKISGRGVNGLIKGLGNFLYNGATGSSANMMQRAPWLVQILFNIARLIIALAGLALIGAGKTLDWILGKKPDTGNPNQTISQPPTPQPRQQQAGKQKQAGQQSSEQQQQPPLPGPSQRPTQPGDPSQSPASPGQGPQLRADQKNGQSSAQHINRRVRVIHPPNNNNPSQGPRR